jgi:hypothetical protein
VKTTYRSFGRGVAVRWDNAKQQYEVLVRGSKVYRTAEKRNAYDYAESLLGGSHDNDGGE